MDAEKTFSVGKFVLDAANEKGFIGPFEAWSDGEEWNGWAAPFFERAEADRVLSEIRATGGQGNFDAAQDVFNFFDRATEEWQESPSEVIGTPSGSRTVYGIGAGDWIWDYAESDNGTTG